MPEEKENRVLLIGGGGREHAIAFCLSRSSAVSQIFVAPGNAGTAAVARTQNVVISVSGNFEEVVELCRSEGISLVLVGPEDPLAAGIADALQEAGIPCFGPSRAAAEIEASKAFSKDFMHRHNIPTAKYETFTDPILAREFIEKADYPALVVKADGLAAGKGVVVAGTKAEACDAVQQIKSKFGAASQKIVVEELLTGPEVSALCFTDGKTVKMMPLSQDNKRLLDGDKGANTGGMGAICPYSTSTEMKEFIENEILLKTVHALQKEGITYRGVLYAGLMLTPSGPKVLEFNCRFGDPETQAILSLLTSDLFEICRACTNGSLDEIEIVWEEGKAVCGIVMVSKGYPEAYPKGLPITGLDTISDRFGKDAAVFHAGTKVGASGEVLTSGGRVLGVFSKSKTLSEARKLSLDAIACINFDGAFYRKDIGVKAEERNGLTYASSGVDITAGNDFVNEIKPLCRKTTRIGCAKSGSVLGSFGATFDMKEAGYEDPITVITTDGVGTKLEIAQETGKLKSIGEDLVAMCVNDLLCEGAEPVQFLDYFATGKLITDEAVQVVEGIAKGCEIAGCSLAGDELLTPTQIYVKRALPLIREGLVGAVAHITGGGLLENIPRVLPDGLAVELDAKSWKVPQVFKWIQAVGHVADSEMWRTFNCGIGMVFIVPDSAADCLRKKSEDLIEIGRVVNRLQGGEAVKILNRQTQFPCYSNGHIDGNAPLEINGTGKTKKNVAVFISGTGTNMEALIHHTKVTKSVCQVVLVVSDKPEARGLTTAQKFGIETKVMYIPTKKEIMDPQELHEKILSAFRNITEVLKSLEIDVICLAGFMRIVPSEFTNEWKGKLINVHPSLLPKYRGLNTHQKVLSAGERFTGCTVHFVRPEVDAGPTIDQARIAIRIGDTVDELTDRVKMEEHRIFPLAMEDVASGAIRLNYDWTISK